MVTENKEQEASTNRAELVNKILAVCGEYDLQTVLTVLVNIAGQIVASLAEGKPSYVHEKCKSIAANIKTAAYAKLTYDVEQKKKAH